MHIDITFDDGVAFLDVIGTVDVMTADTLRTAGQLALAEFFCGTLRINLSGVTNLDSHGVDALVEIHGRADRYHSVIIENPSPRALNAFQRVGASSFLGGRDELATAS
jgi:anti-anti-sigma regulatory factor